MSADNSCDRTRTLLQQNIMLSQQKALETVKQLGWW